MSSPKVITFKQLPVQEAIDMNHKGCVTCLGLAKVVYNDMFDRIREMNSCGKHINVDVLPLADAEAETWSQFHNLGDYGMGAFKYSHAYWQSLKHPHSERVIREYAQWKTDTSAAEFDLSVEAQQAIEQACQEFREKLREETSSIPINQLKAVEVTAAEKGREQLEQTLVESILRSAKSVEETTEIQGQIAAVLLAAPGAQRVLKLELLRTDLAEQRTQRRRAAALELFNSEMLRHFLLQLSVHEGALEKSLELLGMEEEERFKVRIQGLRTIAETVSIEAAEEEVEKLKGEISEASRRKSILSVVKKVLHQQGYDSVQEMETITAEGIRANYFQDPATPGRWVEVAFKEDSGLLSVELVKEEATGSSTDEQVDLEAQNKLCKSITRAEEQLSSAFAIDLKRNVAPGATVKVKAGLKKRRTRHASQANTLQAKLPGGG